MWTTWIAELVANYTIDGIRLDSTQQVDNAFFKPFQSAAGGMHILGEILNGDPAYVCPYQNYLSGVMNYPA
jgi:alpha-amylase